MAGAFESLIITNRLACETPAATVFAVLPANELVSARDSRAVEEQESMSFQVSRIDSMGTPRTDAINAIRAGRIATTRFDDGTFHEWRIATVSSGRGENGIITVTCVSLWLDLVERATGAGKGWISDLVRGERNYEYELVERTPSNILSTYVIPHGPPWLALGTVEPTNVLHTLSVSRMTPGAGALAVRNALRDMDVTCELALRRNGVTNYLLDLVTQIGSGAPTPVLTPINALRALRVVSDATLQANRVLVKGNMSPDAMPGVWGIARWRVDGLLGPDIIALGDRAGGARPVAFDGQHVGAFLLRCKTGATYRIDATNAATGAVTLEPNRDTYTIAIGEHMEFRLTEPLTNTRRFVSAIAAFGSGGPTQSFLPFEITATTASTMTLADKFSLNNDPVTADNAWQDWFTRRMGFVLMTNFLNFVAPGTFTNLGTTAGVQVGDVALMVRTDIVNNWPFTGGYQQAFVVDAVRATEVDVHARDGGVMNFAMGGGGSGVAKLRFYRPVPTLQRIRSSVAATNVVTLDSNGGAIVADIAEIVQPMGAGEVPSYVDHPTSIQADPIGYGLKVAELTRPQGGVSQIGFNAWQRAWANLPGLPDGWTIQNVLAGASVGRNTTPAFTRYGGASLMGTGSALQINAPASFPAWDSGHTRLSARCFVYLTQNLLVRFAVWPAKADGTADVQFTPLHSITVQGPGGVAANTPIVALHSWVELKVEGIVRDYWSAPYGVVAAMDWSNGGAPGPIIIYLDAIEVYPHMACPSDAFEFGDAPQLLQSGNQHLRQYATPPLAFTFQVTDLARIFPSEYARLAITLGANVRAADVEENVDVTVRTLRIDRDLIIGADTQLTVANRPTLSTTLAAEGNARQMDIIAAIQAGQIGTGEPSFTPVVGPLTLSPKAEIITPSGGPIITLAQDSAVTFTHATIPGQTASVTVGTPPSRERSSFAL